MSEQRPHITADEAPAILWVTDPDGVCTYLSRQWYELTGQTPDEGLGYGWLDVVHPDDRGSSGEVFAEANRRRVPFRLDYRLRRSDGQYRWAIDAGQPRFSVSGEFLGYVGSVLDITERKAAEETLRRSEEHFRALIEKGADLIAVLGPAGEVHYVSPSFERILGYGLTDIEEGERARILHPRDLPGALGALQRLMDAPGVAVDVELRARHRDGSWRRLQAVAVNRLDDAAVGGIVVNARDVTALRQAEERLVRVTATSPAVLYTLSLSGDAAGSSWVSGNIEEIMGYSTEEALAPGWWTENLHPDDRSSAQAAMGRLVADGAVAHEYRFRHKDGHYRWVRDQLRVIRGADGSSVEAVGSWMDATEVRELEGRFHEAQKMEAIGRLAGGIAHDFNNVLTAVTGFAQMILEDLDESSPHRQDAEEIVRASERGAALVRQLMAFSRQQVVQPEVIRPDAVIEGMEGMLRRLIGEHVTLVTELDAARGFVRIDKGQLEQLLLNLVVNAHDAMPSGGLVTIGTTRRDPPGEGARSHSEVPSGRCLLVSVSDTGHGIDEALRAKIFEPFFTTKERGKGTGLGLAIVYGIVRQAGGHLHVDSQPGIGATFEIYLPEVEGPQVDPAAPASERPAAEASRFLPVEDPTG